jgi:drug/metabolite transporter (DMT)-like permease
MQTRNMGIFIGVIGILMMIYTGFNYVTEKKVIDLGPLQINREVDHPISWSPVIGAILIIGGIALIVTNKSKVLSS